MKERKELRCRTRTQHQGMGPKTPGSDPGMEQKGTSKREGKVRNQFLRGDETRMKKPYIVHHDIINGMNKQRNHSDPDTD